MNEPYYAASGSVPGVPSGSGPTTVMFNNWRLDPTTNPPLGNWYCDTTCDALVSNNAVLNWYSEDSNPIEKLFRFFWTAPATAPTEADGRIRFYMAAVDADGYFDTFDD